MNQTLLDLILFSEKRRDFLLLLKEGPKNAQEILDRLQVPRTALLPQIKKLKEQNLVIHEEGVYRLSLIGEIVIEKMQPLLDTLKVFEKNEEFWADRNLSPIPPHIMKRISELGNYRLIEPDLSHTFDINPEFMKHVSNSNHILMFFSYFHPQFPAFFLDLARRGTEISLVLNESVYLRLAEDFKKEGEELLRMKNTSLFIMDKTEVEIPAIVASSDKIMVLGLFNESGRFDRQYVISFEPGAIEWGKDLFEYFRDMSREIKIKEK
ncbi:ArsR family transcriptional regulator [Methanosarcina sp. 2.H.T.1A.6]|uniref:helix-turn-helix transcriptional regulator n=1 Tax=unclassified Methanosarcina TaxID=2644672 RepID=UPI000621E381|nr:MULTISPECIES: winged helix-turn-helix domain-containing protein [unclassified Methanosarcina]KKG14855.1 ArsR family transcriptional regulator [Methanosarcina sp. 2.H.T.1A.15]KKG19020.1 ArsR family transcriptional regulator [Methanosarcina sp. 2.H.T.1A.3]KKG20828.1 ArsR family transcriptional regulator [Methanosarcina sp. 2.H.T.1A.6]KKG22225.1 ArsR family transcriptional regulator [Methanosarcina sp. 2.H.T.1A.8]